MAPIDNYRRSSDLPAELAVFPLRGAILLPRASLPLNIFEPRYLSLIDDVISGSRLLGIIQPIDTPSGVESPQGKQVRLHDVGCCGRITAYQELEDGRLVVTVTGVARFDVNKEIETDNPYRTLAVSYTRFNNDFERGHGEGSVDRERLLGALKSYLEANKLQADWPSIMRAPSEVLINALSVMSPYGPEEKQALLEAEDLSKRADVLITLAEMELASGGSSGSTLQ